MAAKRTKTASGKKTGKRASSLSQAKASRAKRAAARSRRSPSASKAIKIVARNAPGQIANHVYPFAQGWRLGNLVFTGGIAAEDPRTGKIVGDDIVTQTERVFETLKAILEEAGSSLGKVLKVTVFFAHFSDKAGFETVYGKYFPKDRPGRTSAAVTMLGKGILVELDAIAYV